MTYIIKIPSFQRQTYGGKLAESIVYLGVSKYGRQSKMAAETGNTYISEFMKGTINIPTTNPGFKTRQR